MGDWPAHPKPRCAQREAEGERAAHGCPTGIIETVPHTEDRRDEQPAINQPPNRERIARRLDGRINLRDRQLIFGKPRKGRGDEGGSHKGECEEEGQTGKFHGNFLFNLTHSGVFWFTKGQEMLTCPKVTGPPECWRNVVQG